MTARRLPKRFEAHSCTLGRCDCGCGTLKLILCDAAGNHRAAAGFRPEDWLSLIEDILAECSEMTGGGQAEGTLQ
jgi:hypothetical protein